MRGLRQGTERLGVCFLIPKIDIKVLSFWGIVRHKRGNLRGSLIIGTGVGSVDSNSDDDDHQALPALTP